MNSESNFLLLRVDIHNLWDQRIFTIVPRVQDHDQGQPPSWVTYMLTRLPSQEVVNLYHDVCLQPLVGIDPFFLFCRFAWTIFETLDVFLDQGSERWLKIKSPLTGFEEVKKCSTAQCRDKIFTKRERTQSPKKRKQSADTGDDEVDEDISNQGRSRSSSSSRESIAPYRSFWIANPFDEELNRGRKRKRSSSAPQWERQLIKL